MEINGYQLSRSWFDFCFDNPEKISPNHTAIYFFAIEHCNRLGWKEKFGFPTQMTMDAIGIKKHQTYIKYFNELCEWGFFRLVQKSSNQYSANIISLQVALPKNGKALDKAFITHAAKQTESNGQSTRQSNGTIDKQQTIKPLNQETIKQQTSNGAAVAASIPFVERKKNKVEEIIFPFDSLEFKSMWSNWIEFRRQIKKPYKSDMSLQGALKNLSKYPEDVAIKMIEQSIANQWQGIFELKQQQNNGITKKQQQTNGIVNSFAERFNNHFGNGQPGGGS